MAALFPAVRARLLAVLFGRPDTEFYLRELVRLTQTGVGAVQRELSNLVEAGLLLRAEKAGRVYFRANRQCPVFAELAGLVSKTSGLSFRLRQALMSVKGVRLAFVHGSVAKGEETALSDLDLLVIGSSAFRDVVEALSGLEQELGREINPSVYSIEEFRQKLAAGHHFVKTVLASDKMFIMGSQHELDQLVGTRSA